MVTNPTPTTLSEPWNDLKALQESKKPAKPTTLTNAISASIDSPKPGVGGLFEPLLDRNLAENMGICQNLVSEFNDQASSSGLKYFDKSIDQSALKYFNELNH